MTFRRKGGDTVGTTLTETLKNRKKHPGSARTAGGGKCMVAIKTDLLVGHWGRCSLGGWAPDPPGTWRVCWYA